MKEKIKPTQQRPRQAAGELQRSWLRETLLHWSESSLQMRFGETTGDKSWRHSIQQKLHRCVSPFPLYNKAAKTAFLFPIAPQCFYKKSKQKEEQKKSFFLNPESPRNQKRLKKYKKWNSSDSNTCLLPWSPQSHAEVNYLSFETWAAQRTSWQRSSSLQTHQTHHPTSPSV